MVDERLPARLDDVFMACYDEKSNYLPPAWVLLRRGEQGRQLLKNGEMLWYGQ